MNEKMIDALVQFSMGFNDQNSSHSALTKDVLEKILINGARQLY